MQFFTTLITLALAFTASVYASPAPAEGIAARGVWDDCFNQGYTTGYGAGCSSAGNGKRDVEERQLTCTGSNGDAYNQGFNAGFNQGFNACK
ncbi:hypothetical protein CPB85DRAFT_1435410 [Mucidula mucida]|nr:hypothetical protein CPB85DRAFT_1435410 [Mucidula mucida]